MAKLMQNLHAVHSSQSQSIPIRCDFCGGDHPNGHCIYQTNSPKVEVNYMGNQSGFSNNYSQGWKNNQNQNFGWKQDYGSSNKQGPFQQQHPSNYPSMLETMTKVQDTLAKLVVTQENSTATIRNIEIHMGQMAKQIVERQSSQFSPNTTTNPKEHYNKIVTESDKKNRKGRW